MKGSRLQECISGGQSFQYNIHNWYSKDCHNGTGIYQTGKQLCHQAVLVVVCIDGCGVIHSLMQCFLQILGAFVGRDGVPVQGMKIKNVVPGKKKSFFEKKNKHFSGQSIANMSLDVSLFMTFEPPHFLSFL